MIEKGKLRELLIKYGEKILHDDLSWPEMQVCHEIMLEAAETIRKADK